MVGFGSLSCYDNQYLFVTITSFNESLHTIVIGKKHKLTIENWTLLLHKRFCHIPKRRLERHVPDSILDPFDFLDCDLCVNYIKGKQTNIRIFNAKRKLELLGTKYSFGFRETQIFVDHSLKLLGMVKKYFIILIDTFSWYVYLYLIQEKSYSLNVSKKIIMLKLKTNSTKQIKELNLIVVMSVTTDMTVR